MSGAFRGQPIRVLAITPYTRGIGFAVLEGKEKLVDWGLKEARAEKHRQCLCLVEGLIDTYQPDVVVVEEVRDKSCRRCPRVRELVQAIEHVVKEQHIQIRRFPRRTVQELFSTSRTVTKHQMTEIMVKHFPELAPWQPPVRKVWMSEDPRMSMFDAAAFAYSFFHFEGEH